MLAALAKLELAYVNNGLRATHVGSPMNRADKGGNMNRQWLRRGIALTALMTLWDGAPASSQEINGTPGSPSATITIDGSQLPPPPVPFGGVIKETALRIDALLAAAGCAAERRAERPAHHDR